MTTDPKQNPLKAASELETEAGKLETRARQMRQKAAQIREIAKAQATAEARLNNAREQERKRKQVAAIQQRTVLEASDEARPSFVVEWLSELVPFFGNFMGLAIRLGMLAVLVGGFYLAYQAVSNKKQNERDASSDATMAAAVKFDSLDDVLKNATPEQLRFQSELRKDDIFKTDVERIKDAQSRVQIAERMLKMRLGEDLKKFANQSWIYSRLELEVLREKYEVSDMETRNDLKKFYRERAEHSDERVRDITLLSRAFLSSTELAYLKSSVGKRYEEIAMEHFREAIAVAEGIDDLRLLYGMAVLTYRRHESRPTLAFLQELVESDIDESDKEIAALMTGARRELGINLRTLPAEPERTGEPNQILIEDTQQKVDQLLANASLTPQQSGEVVSMITRVIQSGSAVAAKAMVDKVNNEFEKMVDVPETDRDNVAQLKLVLDKYNKPFPIFGLRDPSGDQFEFDPEKNQDSLVVFVETDAVSEGQAQVLRIAEKAEELLVNGKLQILIVYLDPLLDRNWIEIRARELPVNCFWVRVDKSSDAGREFMAQFPVLWSPFWIILDSELTLTAIDPPEQMMLEKIQQLSK